MSVIVTVASAFSGALMAFGLGGYWLASKFSNIYRRMSENQASMVKLITDHEKEDLKRFSDIRQDILNVVIQTQAATIDRTYT